MDDHITSPSNSVVKRMRQLSLRKYRTQQGATVVYGIQPVWQAVEAGAHIDILAYSPQLLKQPAALTMVADLEAAGVRVLRMSPDLFRKLEERDGPAGLAAVVEFRLAEPDDLPVGADSVLIALHRIANPGNLGTILRTADATGAAGLVLIGPTADPADPAAIKASMGAAFNVPIARIADIDTFFAWARSGGIQVVTTSAHATESIWTASPRWPVAVLMGSEGSGLTDSDLHRGDLQISIPMVGKAESLNLAVATGVVLYELWRRRGQ